METLLLSKLERDHLMNLALIKHIENHEEQITDAIYKYCSHLINTHHILNCRFSGLKPESEEWDVLPSIWHEKLQVENYRTSISLLDQSNVHPESRFNFLYGILENNTHLRAQILFQLKELCIPLPNLTLLVSE
ncbi:MAG: hypothetical protein RIT43_2524 [Bacteroidota bacterium]